MAKGALQTLVYLCEQHLGNLNNCLDGLRDYWSFVIHSAKEGSRAHRPSQSQMETLGMRQWLYLLQAMG